MLILLWELNIFCSTKLNKIKGTHWLFHRQKVRCVLFTWF